MRYVMFAAIALTNLIFTGAVFPNINIAGIFPDIIVCSMVSIVILEKRITAAVVGFVCGLLLDMLFTGVIGFYALPYLITGAVLFAAVKKFSYLDRFFIPMLIAAGANLFREILSALITYMLGSEFSVLHMLVRYVLPEMLLTGIFMLLYHLILSRVYRNPAVHPVNPEEFKRL